MSKLANALHIAALAAREAASTETGAERARLTRLSEVLLAESRATERRVAA